MMRFRFPLLLLLLPLVAVQAGELFRDDFRSYPSRVLSEPVRGLTNAIEEYHYLPHRGVPLQPWENVILHDDAWAGGDEDGVPYMEMHIENPLPLLMNPTLITGDSEWSNYAVEAGVRPLSKRDMAGIVFRYRHNRHYYLFSLSDGTRARLRVRLPLETAYREADWRELGEVEFPYETTRAYTLRVENDGPRVRAYIDGKLVLEASDDEMLKGKAGITANFPARFTDFVVSTSDSEQLAISQRIAAREAELARLRSQNPKPRLWKRFRTPGFGAFRNVRFGDLNGDGRPEMLIAQNTRRVRTNDFAQISCLTAVTLDGEVLWQIGRPDPYNDITAHDVPFQIHDITGDGKFEVVMVKDFKLQVLDGATGKRIQQTLMPAMPETRRYRPYEREVGDSIAFFNFSGKNGAREILVKDRYENFWVYNNDLQMLWSGTGQLGHFPYAFDMDGDGKEEMLIGYAMWSSEGKQLWSQDANFKDHADGIFMGNISGDPSQPPLVYACASDEGFLMFDRDGKLLKQLRIGHAQTPSVGKYRMDVPGLQLMNINFWKNPGIITLFDWEGKIVEQGEPIHSGSPVLPVNWRGDGQEFAMLSANVAKGGMIDGHLRRVVQLPDDGHPETAFAVLNLTGDPRDEIVVWNTEEVWIYTQDRPFEGERIYAPVRNPEYNESNYRTTVSLPRWVENTPAEWEKLLKETWGEGTQRKD
jgi:rhamnogalacturonan endolyase